MRTLDEANGGPRSWHPARAVAFAVPAFNVAETMLWSR